MQTKILVVGGAGYIGSHMTKKLLANGYRVVVLDDLSGGFADAVDGTELVIGSTSDSKLLSTLLKTHTFTAVLHFASFIAVGESVSNPSKYYNNNVVGSFQLLEAMRTANIKKLIFSSTAAVYGDPQYLPLDENHPTNPINPYGRTKLIIENMLQDYDAAYQFKSICFRYFNAAGADPDGALGECHSPETHLIPLVLEALSGRRTHIDIFGDDYDTPDGTCIRDYVHVDDLCEAHLLALKKLLAGSNSTIYNLGYGQGHSIKEVLDLAVKITKRPLKTAMKSRRPGDPPRLIADAKLAFDELHWKPRYSNLEDIISHAWTWEKKYPWR